MTTFSVAALAAQCQTIHHRALSAATSIDESVAPWNASDSPLTQVSINLKELSKAVFELGDKLGSTKLISEGLKHTLTDRLDKCARAEAIVENGTGVSAPQQLPIEADLLSKYMSWVGLETSVIQGLGEAIQV
jgi:hypothetical protein